MAAHLLSPALELARETQLSSAELGTALGIRLNALSSDLAVRRAVDDMLAFRLAE